MFSFSRFILKHKTAIIIFFVISTLVSAACYFRVGVNYHLADYLPDDAASTTALDVLQEEFNVSTSTLRIFVPDVTIPEAQQYKEKIKDVSGIDSVYWLDDSVDLTQPLALLDQETVEAYYKDNGALYTVVLINNANEVTVINDLRRILGSSAAIAGDAANNAASQIAVKAEVLKSMAVLGPCIIILLLLSTASWLEPLLFLLVIAVAIVINLGSNIIFGEISYITQSVAPILQLAVSMDYTIFLLNAFGRHREKGQLPEPAMVLAIKETASTIIASGLTTLFGFLALTLMDFKIGVDIGLILAKGIVISMLTAVILLPALTIKLLPWIDKTRHRSFMPSFAKLSKLSGKIKFPVLLCILLILCPMYLAQQNNLFTYGSTGTTEGLQIGQDTQLINDLFGESAQLVLLVPREQWSSEISLTKQLQLLDNVNSVVAYTTAVSATIPTGFLEPDQASQFLSEHYSRIILYASLPDEGDASFALVEQVRALAASCYGSNYYLCGSNVNIYDMRTTVTADNSRVNIAAIIAIGLVLLLTFRSVSLPLILLLTIESAIWINLAIPYFMNSSMPYLAYLIINTVQLGATIDYAILFSQQYLENRRVLPLRRALEQTGLTAAPTILVPAAILTGAGIALAFISSNAIVGQFGLMLARGTILSVSLVLFMLPALLTICDRLIEKTTMKTCFFHPQSTFSSTTSNNNSPERKDDISVG